MNDTDATVPNSEGANEMSNLPYHIIRAATLSLLVWCVLAHLGGLIQSTKDFLAASQHDKTMMMFLLSLFTFVSYFAIHIICFVVANLPKAISEMAKQTPHAHDVQK
jgi:hypothetical protein